MFRYSSTQVVFGEQALEVVLHQLVAIMMIVEHRDNHEGHGVLKPGDVQWMTAGRGILHREMAHNKQQAHTLQLWLNLPAENKMVEPTYQDLRGDKAPVRREPRVEARVFSGRSGNVEAIPRV
ncbi:MAG: pirin family protein, partial [Nitrososphaeraceae archaeon]|nr:pirin family protein [Nitrososphaeraceae archaeon]